MRIAIDVQATIQQKSGIGQYAEALIKHLDRERHTYFFLKPTPRHSRESGNPERDLSTLQRIYWESFQLPYEAKKAKADLIHTVGFSAPRLGSCKVVSTVHDFIGKVLPNRFLNLGWGARFYWKHWLPSSFKKADHIIASSENTKRDILRFLSYPENQISVIHLAADACFRKIDKKEALDVISAKFVIPAKAGIPFKEFILSVGTLEPRKNLKNLISAYSILPREIRKSYPLVIIGKPGWGGDELSRLVRELSLDQDIHFIGYVETDALVFFYNAATLFVYPSLYEGFGLPLVEAMSCGTPVISSNISSIPEVVSDAALLVDPSDPLGLADAMKSLLLDFSLRKILSERGLSRSKAFSWERVAKLTTGVYESVA